MTHTLNEDSRIGGPLSLYPCSCFLWKITQGPSAIPTMINKGRRVAKSLFPDPHCSANSCNMPEHSLPNSSNPGQTQPVILIMGTQKLIALGYMYSSVTGGEIQLTLELSRKGKFVRNNRLLLSFLLMLTSENKTLQVSQKVDPCTTQLFFLLLSLYSVLFGSLLTIFAQCITLWTI